MVSLPVEEFVIIMIQHKSNCVLFNIYICIYICMTWQSAGCWRSRPESCAPLVIGLRLTLAACTLCCSPRWLPRQNWWQQVQRPTLWPDGPTQPNRPGYQTYLPGWSVRWACGWSQGGSVPLVSSPRTVWSSPRAPWTSSWCPLDRTQGNIVRKNGCWKATNSSSQHRCGFDCVSDWE